MSAPLPDAATIAELLAPRMLIHCPPAELNAAVPYEGWSDVDALMRGTTMDACQTRRGLEPNAVISLGLDLLHYPALDIDGHAFIGDNGTLFVQDDSGGMTEIAVLGDDVALIPSAHNHHAYSTKSFTWGEYADLIETMANAACLGRGWAALSLRRGFTLLRHPLHPKPHTPKEEVEEPW